MGTITLFGRSVQAVILDLDGVITRTASLHARAWKSIFDDAVRTLADWRKQGVKVALVTSSKNGERIVEAAAIGHLFDASVDGIEAEREQLPGKPEPDVFLRAAEKLGVRPRDAAVFEDAAAGVEAGRRGEFGLVVGVARSGESERLQKSGADRVVGYNRLESEVAERLIVNEDLVNWPNWLPLTFRHQEDHVDC